MSTEPHDPPPISIRKRLLAFVGVIILACVASGGFRMWYNADPAGLSYDQLLAELDANETPWRLLDIEAVRATVPEIDNSARIVVMVDRLLPGAWPKNDFYEALTDIPPPELLSAEVRKLLADEMATAAPALLEARKMATMPNGRHKLVLGGNPLTVPLKDQQDTRKAAQLLSFDAWDLALKGDSKAALLSARASFHAGRSLGDEPFFISQLIRIAVISMSLTSIERTLALGEASEADLLEINKLLDLEENTPTMLVAYRGERAMQQDLFERIHSGEIPAEDVFGSRSMLGKSELTLRERIFGISRADLRRQQAVVLNFLNRAVAIARRPVEEQGTELAKLDGEMQAAAKENRMLRMLTSPLASMNKAFRRNIAQVRCMRIVLALERYRMKTGQWPKNLDELKPTYLERVPLDPFDGLPMRYVRKPDSVIVYTVGDDGIDNGGTLPRARSFGSGMDFGYELWDVKHRRQPARPRPKIEDDPGGPP